VHRDALKAGARVLIVDDVLATGGTISAVCRMLKKFKARICGVAFLIELEFLHGREKLKRYPVFSLLRY